MQISSPKSFEKNRMRGEIDSHIREFLEKGGKIDVLSDDKPRELDSRTGMSWSVLDEDLGL